MAFKIGVLSDTHDHLPNIQKAMDIFLTEKVEKIFHGGDLVAPFIKRSMEEIRNAEIEVVGVFGNNDGERDNMNRLIQPYMEVKGDFYETEIHEKKIALYHGTDNRIVKNLVHSHLYDLVLTGHTHQVKIEVITNTLHVNPGEACGYLSGDPTCAIIDLDHVPFNREAVEIIHLRN